MATGDTRKIARSTSLSKCVRLQASGIYRSILVCSSSTKVVKLPSFTSSGQA